MAIAAKPRGNVHKYYTGSNNHTISREDDKNWISLLITNDGVLDITVTVNEMVMTIKADETLNEDFSDFNIVTITATNNTYRIWLRE